MSAFEKITGITLFDLEKVLELCVGDKIVASYEVIDSEDAFEEGYTSRWKLKWFTEAEGDV